MCGKISVRVNFNWSRTFWMSYFRHQFLVDLESCFYLVLKNKDFLRMYRLTDWSSQELDKIPTQFLSSTENCKISRETSRRVVL